MVMKTIMYILSACFVCCGMSAAMTSCSEDTYGPDPSKDWAGTATVFTPTDDAGFNTYYMPAIGRCGDPMPFFDQKGMQPWVLVVQSITRVISFITSIIRVITRFVKTVRW